MVSHQSEEGMNLTSEQLGKSIKGYDQSGKEFVRMYFSVAELEKLSSTEGKERHLP